MTLQWQVKISFLVGVGLCLTVTANEIAAANTEHSPLVDVFYDLEVLAYCGMTSANLKDNFDRELGRIVAQENADPSGIEEARMAAWTLAYREWQNRGLGGFRNWCRTEGAAALERFVAP